MQRQGYASACCSPVYCLINNSSLDDAPLYDFFRVGRAHFDFSPQKTRSKTGELILLLLLRVLRLVLAHAWYMRLILGVGSSSTEDPIENWGIDTATAVAGTETGTGTCLVHAAYFGRWILGYWRRRYYFIKSWKTSAVSTTVWMVETQLCKLRGTPDAFV